MTGDIMYGYRQEGAREAHIVRDVNLQQAFCGTTLPSIPNHQMPPEAVCSRCRNVAGIPARPESPPADAEPVGKTSPMIWVLRGADEGRIKLGDDHKYRRGDRLVDDEVYDAEDRGLLILGHDGTPEVTDAGREYIARNARRSRPRGGRAAAEAVIFREARDVAARYLAGGC